MRRAKQLLLGVLAAVYAAAGVTAFVSAEPSPMRSLGERAIDAATVPALSMLKLLMYLRW